MNESFYSAYMYPKKLILSVKNIIQKLIINQINHFKKTKRYVKCILQYSMNNMEELKEHQLSHWLKIMN